MRTANPESEKPSNSHAHRIPDAEYFGSKEDLEVRYISTMIVAARGSVNEEWLICLSYTNMYSLLEGSRSRESLFVLSLRVDEVGIPRIELRVVCGISKKSVKAVYCVELNESAGGKAVTRMIQERTLKFSGVFRGRRQDWVEKVVDILIRSGYVNGTHEDELNSPTFLDTAGHFDSYGAPGLKVPTERRQRQG